MRIRFKFKYVLFFVCVFSIAVGYKIFTPLKSGSLHVLNEQKYNALFQSKAKNRFLSKKLVLQGISGDTITMSGIMDNLDRELLVLRIPMFSCSSCVNREISVLKEFHKSFPDFKIAVIPCYEEFRSFKFFLSYTNLQDFLVCNFAGNFSVIDECRKPYYLLIDRKYKIQRAFVVVKSNGKKTDKFLNSIYVQDEN